jgi:hypothetical protein
VWRAAIHEQRAGSVKLVSPSGQAENLLFGFGTGGPGTEGAGLGNGPSNCSSGTMLFDDQATQAGSVAFTSGHIDGSILASPGPVGCRVHSGPTLRGPRPARGAALALQGNAGDVDPCGAEQQLTWHRHPGLLAASDQAAEVKERFGVTGSQISLTSRPCAGSSLYACMPPRSDIITTGPGPRRPKSSSESRADGTGVQTTSAPEAGTPQW